MGEMLSLYGALWNFTATTNKPESAPSLMHDHRVLHSQGSPGAFLHLGGSEEGFGFSSKDLFPTGCLAPQTQTLVSTQD